MVYVIVTHTDMDGVGAAGLYIYYQGEKPGKITFTEPYLLGDVLDKLSSRKDVEKIVFSDLGLNANVVNQAVHVLGRLINRGVVVEWYDHHVWEDEWIAKFKNAGINLYLDRSTCATGVVAKYAPRHREIDEEFVNELVSGVCAGDLFRFDHWRGPWFLRLVKRRDDSRWRKFVLEKIAEGTLWCDEFTEKVVERLERELNGYSLVDELVISRMVDGLKIAVAPQIEDIENSFTAAYIIGRYGADVVAITSRDGKVSLRSSRYNVRDLALAMGGGGHPRAAGFKLYIPISVRLKQLVDKKTIYSYVLNVISKKIYENGGLEKL